MNLTSAKRFKESFETLCRLETNFIHLSNFTKFIKSEMNLKKSLRSKRKKIIYFKNPSLFVKIILIKCQNHQITL